MKRNNLPCQVSEFCLTRRNVDCNQSTIGHSIQIPSWCWLSKHLLRWYTRLCFPSLYNVFIALTLKGRKSAFTNLKNSKPPSSTNVSLNKWLRIWDFSLTDIKLLKQDRNSFTKSPTLLFFWGCECLSGEQLKIGDNDTSSGIILLGGVLVEASWKFQSQAHNQHAVLLLLLTKIWTLSSSVYLLVSDRMNLNSKPSHSNYYGASIWSKFIGIYFASYT